MAQPKDIGPERYEPRDHLTSPGFVRRTGIRAIPEPSPEHPDLGENLIDIMESLPTCLEGKGLAHYVVVGGGASAVLTLNDTALDMEGHGIIPHSKPNKFQYRPNKKGQRGTQTDLDILVLTTDPEEVEAFYHALLPDPKIMEGNDQEAIAREQQKPGAKLKLGITPLGSAAAPTLFGRLAEGLISDRVVDEDGNISWQIADVSVTLPPEYFEPWWQQLPSGQTIPVLHPVIQMACYAARTGHGIRPRDVEKLEAMEKIVGPAFGIRLVWGPDKKQVAIVPDHRQGQPYVSALEFVVRKNYQLRQEQLRERRGPTAAALMAGKIALHRLADAHPKLIELGQHGWFYDNVLARVSKERQNKSSPRKPRQQINQPHPRYGFSES